MTVDLAHLRQRLRTEGRVLPFDGFSIGVFDPAAAAQLEQANFSDLYLGARLADALRQRPDRCPVLWKDVRAALVEQTRKFNTQQHLRDLRKAMRQAVASASTSGNVTDLTWLAERSIADPLLPMIISGLSPSEHRAVLRHQHAKIASVLFPFESLLRGAEKLFPVLKRMKDFGREIRTGRIVARQLRRRLSGKAPAQEDYAQAVLTMADRLGMGRAAYVVTTVLAAVTGAPGTVAACILFELLRRDDWRLRIRQEFQSLSERQFLSDPLRSAPIAFRFIREAMRLWSFPLMVQRGVRKDVTLDQLQIKQGNVYCLSSYLLHRDEAYWDEPDTFNPDRWLKADCVAQPGTYVPFGWAPRVCVGASLGLSQLMLFVQLFTTEFEIELERGARPYIELDGIAVPRDFRGTVKARASQLQADG